MKKFLFLTLFFASLLYFHPAKAEIYFSQPNSNGYQYSEYSPYGHQGPVFKWDDGSVNFLQAYYGPETIANFPSGADYIIATTSVTSYVTDIILQIRDSDQAENQDYGITFWCSNQEDFYPTHGVYYSSLVNSGTFSSNDFVTVDFKFTAPNCDLSKYQIHQLYFYQYIYQGALSTTNIQTRTQNVDSIAGFGSSNENGDIFENYESQITIMDSIPTTTPVSAKTPVLIIPGVLGTDIKKGDDLLWANTKMAWGFDGFMDPLGFNLDMSPSDGSLKATDVIKKLILNTGVAKFKVYDYTDSLITQLTSPEIGYTEGKDLFTFPYDWRFGVSEDTVNQLKGQIQYIASTTGSSVVNVVAHSTGGLLVKKYVMENPASHHIGKAIFVGVPNLGSPLALKDLTVGDDFGVLNLDPAEMKKIGKNMPVVYDLTPTQEYYNQVGSFFHMHNPLTNPVEDKDLSFTDTMQTLVGGGYANSLAITNSTTLHTSEFDNYDLRNEGVDLYNVVGCKAGTLGKFTEWVSKNALPTFNFPKIISGDGTVPFASADSLKVDGTKTFFVQNINHSKLLSDNGPRQQIINLLTGSTLSTDGKVLTRSEVKNNPSLCEINGESLKIHSPLAIDIIDQSGNHSGPLADGAIENSIPGADYEVWGEEKYVFLPTDNNQQYQINVAGTGVGTFTLDDETINADATTQTQVFSNLPVTPDLTGQVNLGSGDNQTTLSLKASPTSTPIVVTPSSVVNGDQSLDLTPPVSTSTISGAMGDPGFYNSNVKINLSAIDPTVEDNASTTSGLLKTQYSLDNQIYQDYNTSSPVTVTTEGQHSISFFSTDRAGNNEEVQSVDFVIDKTAPEFVIQFSQSLQDLQFTATDTLPTVIYSTTTPNKVKFTPKVKVIDQDNIITATDSAGNTAQIILKDKNRKKALKAEIQSLTYNNQPVDISKTVLRFNWSYDKNSILKTLEQHIKSKKDFNIDAVYKPNSTQLTGKDQSGKINKTLNGLTLLKVTSSLGDFGWGY